MEQLQALEHALEHFKQTRQNYEEAKQYYEGTVPERFSSDRLRRAIGNIRTPSVSFAATPVNAVANRLELAGVSSTDEAADEFVQQLWADNDLDIESNDVHLWTLVYGDGYLTAWPSEQGYSVNFNSPLTTALFYDAENPRQKVFGAKLWAEAGMTRLNLYWPGWVEKFYTTKDKYKPSDFVPFVDESTDNAGVMESPFKFIPIWHMRTRKPYGIPEHKPAFGVQDMLTKNLVAQLVANDFHGLPQRYVLTEGMSSDYLADDDSEELTAGAGEVWYLDGVKAVGQFDAAAPGSYLEPFESYVRSMAALTDTPLHLFDSGFSAPSGESLRVAEAPLVKKCRSRARVFGSVWQQMLRDLLEHEGLETNVTVQWQSIESVSAKDTWETVQRMRDVGLSLEAALRHGTELDEVQIEAILQQQQQE